MENKAVNTAKKAKRGILSVVFSRTALIALLLVLQLGLMFGLATILSEYAVYVYGVTTVIQALVVINIINEKSNQEFRLTWILLILIFPLFGCLFYIFVKSEIGTRFIGERLNTVKLETRKYLSENKDIIEELRLSKNANANLAHYMGR